MNDMTSQNGAVSPLFPFEVPSSSQWCDSPESHQRVEAEITRLLYAQASVGFLATLVNASILVGVLHTEVPHPIVLYAWLGTLFAITTIRLVLVRAYKRADPTVEQAPRWRRFFILGIVSTGVTWGSASVVSFPPELHDQVFLAFVLGGMSAGAITIMASAQYAPFGFLLPVLGPLAARFFYQGHELGVPMGVMIVLFFCGLMLAVRQTRAATVEAFRLRFTNLDLIDQIAQQASALAKANNTLQDEIAAQKETQVAFQASEVRYRQLFENTNDGIATLTLDGIVTEVNGGAELILGWSREEMVGHHQEEFTTVEAGALARERIHRVLAGEQLPSLFELELLRKDGTVVPAEVQAQMMRNQAGIPLGVQTIFRDITEHKHLEEELERQYNNAPNNYAPQINSWKPK